jgi:predicted DNA-binding transcriptional regulator AlpA
MPSDSSLLSIPLIIRRARLKEIVGMSPAKIDQLEKAGKFPKRRQWSEGIVGWSGEEVARWVADQASTRKKGA